MHPIGEAMKHWKLASTTIAALMLVAGCATRTATELLVLDESYSTILRRVKVIQQEQRAATRLIELQRVNSVSCQRVLGDRAATREDAIAQLQVKADRVGGDAIIVGACSEREHYNVGENCFSVVRCEGVAATMQP